MVGIKSLRQGSAGKMLAVVSEDSSVVPITQVTTVGNSSFRGSPLA